MKVNKIFFCSDAEYAKDDMDGFTPVISKRNKKNNKKKSDKNVRSKGVDLSGTSSKIRASKDHPLCDIFPGPRTRSKDRNYL